MLATRAVALLSCLRTPPFRACDGAGPPAVVMQAPSGCKYGSKQYWDGMYSGSGQAAEDGLPATAYSWYCGWSELQPFWEELVPSTAARVLIPGVGNDVAAVDLFDAGWNRLTIFDYSQQAVERAAHLFADRPVDQLLTADATALPMRDGAFDAVLDKGTLDAIGIAGEEQLVAATSELARTCSPGAVVVSVSRALDAELLLSAFDRAKWDAIRDGGLHITECGAASTDLGASLFAWRRRAPARQDRTP